MVVIPARRAAGRGAPEPPAELSVLDHLGELRDRIIRSVVAIAVGAVACWFLYGGEGLRQQLRPAPYFELITSILVRMLLTRRSDPG